MKQLFFLILILVKSYLFGQIPNFAVVDTNNVEFKLHDFIDKDKVTLISYWAEWCLPCKLEFNAWKKYTSDWIGFQNVNLIAISLDKESARKAATLKWNENDWKGQLLFGDLSSSLPYYYLYDKSQNLIREKRGYDFNDASVLDSIIRNLSLSTSISHLNSNENIKITIQNNQLAIESISNIKELELFLYTLEGKLLKNINIQFENNNLIQVDLENIQGFHLIKLEGKNLKLSKKIYIN